MLAGEIKMEHALTAKAEIARIPFLQLLWADLLKRLQQTDPELFRSRTMESNP